VARKRRSKSARKTTRRATRSKASALQLKTSTRRQINGIAQICLGVILLLVLNGEAGPIGDAAKQGLTFFTGAYSAAIPLFLLLSGTFHALAPNTPVELKRTTGLSLCVLAFLGIMHLGAPTEDLAIRRDEYAGAIGFLMSVPFVLFASKPVGYTVLAGLFAAGLFVGFEPDFAGVIAWFRELRERSQVATSKKAKAVATKEKEEVEDEEEDLVEKDILAPELNIVRPAFAQQVVKDVTKQALEREAKKKKVMTAGELRMKDTRYAEWKFPELELLESAQSELKINDEELKAQARLVEQKLREFDIVVTVKDAHPGPSVTQFTLEPAEGVKISKIANLKDDLALALAAQSLRIEAPIPGKSLVGLEMPNRERTVVHLREILESNPFRQSTSNLTLPLGRDVSGNAVVASLDDMPHLLIAGATNSGKSVCMNTFLTALLYQNAPHQLKLILIDPKRVELMLYDQIPHLLTPVITESEKALQALRWAVAEMGRRLHRFSEAGARNIDEYNEKQSDDDTKLPRIVIVIDELADLMMRQLRRDTELMVTRIAQMARATGIHLIIATQRPSVDVITGLIKANMPTRVAFRTVSSVDSRTILDTIGAEDLLGAGDMLYLTATTPRPQRIQGIFTSTKEVERVINAVKIAGGGEMTEQIGLPDSDDSDETVDTEDIGGHRAYIDLEADDDGGDDLFFDAVGVVRETGKASASLLQRRLSVGYARAAKLLDIMEEKGMIGPPNGAKAREIYMERASA